MKDWRYQLIPIPFVGNETATEWLQKALYLINMMIEEKVLKRENESFF